MPGKVKKVTLLSRLVEEGFFHSKEEATPYLLSGEVYVGSQQVTSAAAKVDPAASLDRSWTGHALHQQRRTETGRRHSRLWINVQNRVCIDAGACTGGFTDCFIKHGAALVYAVEVGFGQLAGSLRQNPRVVNLESTNISDEKLFPWTLFPTWPAWI